MDNRNSFQKGYDELKDQTSTRKNAISESLDNSNEKSGTGEKVSDALVRPKEDVQAQTWGESIKNTAIDAKNAISDTLGWSGSSDKK
ncbi:hypothetical protein ABK040_010149 [Willaertia magna]